MQEVRSVDTGFSVTPQLSADDMPGVKAAGYASVINNRPDHEGGPTQPESSALEAAARAAGLDYQYLPVASAGHSEADARRMVELVRTMPQPVLAFCRSGGRAAALYQKGQQLV